MFDGTGCRSKPLKNRKQSRWSLHGMCWSKK